MPTTINRSFISLKEGFLWGIYIYSKP